MHERDKAWVTPHLKSLIQKRERAFHSNNKDIWKSLRNKIQKEITRLKDRFYRERVQQLKLENPSSWYKHLKMMTGKRNAQLDIIDDSRDDESPDKSDAEKAEEIKTFFSSVNNDIPPLNLHDLPAYLPSSAASQTIYPWEVFRELKKIKPGKSCGPDGIPARLIREFALEIATPLCHILNLSYKSGTVPDQWKKAILVPIPKESPPVTLDKLRPISLTDHFAKVAELFIARQLLSDIKSHLDPKQYGSLPGQSTTQKRRTQNARTMSLP